MTHNLLELFIKNVINQNGVYVRGLNNLIKGLVKLAKVKGIKAKKIESEIGIREHSINWWYTQGFPLAKLDKINQLYFKFLGKEMPLGSIKFGCRGSSSNIKIPKLNRELAYLIGFLYGDGTLAFSNENARIEFYNSSKDFLLKIAEIIVRDFNFKDFKLMSETRKKCCYMLRINSLILSLFFNKLFGMPIGKKKGKLCIPKLIKDSGYVKEFISGFFDADGHVYYTPKYRYRITLTQNNKNFLEEVKAILGSFNIRNTPITDYHKNGVYELRINGRENFNKFVGFFNLKHPNKVFRIKLASQGKSTVMNPRI